MTIHAARRTGYTLQIQHEPESRWIDLIPTKPSIMAQGFVSTEDEGDGHAHKILSDAGDPESEPVEVEAVLYCPQAAALMSTALPVRYQLNQPLRVPTEQQAEHRLACLRDALATVRKETKRR